MPDTSQLNSLAEGEIAALRADGIMPTDAEIVELNALGWAVETPATRRSLARGVPVPCGGAFLWPLTIHAADWLDRVGAKIEPNVQLRFRHPIVANNIQIFATGYAMAHCYSEGNELDLDGDEATEAVVRWAKGLRCRAEAVLECIEAVNGDMDIKELPPDEDGKPMTVGDFSAFLASTNGATPEFWERRCAIPYAVAVMSRIMRQNAADKKPAAEDPRITAERALGWAVEKIRRRHAEEVAANG